MGDRTFLVIIVTFVIIGIYTYNQALTEKGGITPLSELIDFGGLAMFQDEETEKKKETQYVYNYDIKENLNELNRKLAEIEEQRNKLLENRDRNLQELIAFNDDIYDEAGGYLQTINEQQLEFMQRFEELQSLQEGFFNMAHTSDAIQQKLEFANFEQQLASVFRSFSDNPMEEIPGLDLILAEAKKVIANEMDSVSIECENQADCLQQSMAFFERRFKELTDEHILQPGQDLEALAQLAKKMNHEYQFLANNTLASNEKLDESSKRMEKKFQELGQQLVRVSEEDLRGLMYLFKALEAEQMKYLDNLRLHQQRMHELQKQTYTQMDEMTDRLKSTSIIDFLPFVTRYEDQVKKRDFSTKALNTNTRGFNTILEARINAGEDFLFSIAKTMRLQIESLIESNKTSQKKKKIKPKEMVGDKINEIKDASNIPLKEMEKLQEMRSQPMNQIKVAPRADIKRLQDVGTAAHMENQLNLDPKRQMEQLRNINMDHNKTIDSLIGK